MNHVLIYFQQAIPLTPITRRLNKRSHNENDHPSFSDIMMLMTNQQMQEMQSRDIQGRQERGTTVEIRGAEGGAMYASAGPTAVHDCHDDDGIRTESITVLFHRSNWHEHATSSTNPPIDMNHTNHNTSKEKRDEDSYHMPEGKIPEK